MFVTDILYDCLWDDYRHLFQPYGIRAVWSRPLFTYQGKVLGTFAVLYREARKPDAMDLQLIENASHIAGIAIERYIHEEALRHERDRLRLLLDITSSVTSRLDFRQVVEALSTNLFRVMQCDVSALLLPDSESGELRVRTKPLARRTHLRACLRVERELLRHRKEFSVTKLWPTHAGGTPAAQLAPSTIRYYVRAVRDFAAYFKKPPDQLGVEELRQFQLHMLRDRETGDRDFVENRMTSLHFFFKKVLKRYDPELYDMKLTRVPKKLPVVLSLEEVEKLIAAAPNLRDRIILLVLYATGLRRAEAARLENSPISTASA